MSTCYILGNYTQQSLIARKQFEKMVSDTSENLGLAMRILPRDLWRCDPAEHIKGAGRLFVKKSIYTQVCMRPNFYFS